MIIDMHSHIFPEKIASRALDKLSSIIKIPPSMNGTISGLMDSMEKSGVDLSVVLPVSLPPASSIPSFILLSGSMKPLLPGMVPSSFPSEAFIRKVPITKSSFVPSPEKESAGLKSILTTRVSPLTIFDICESLILHQNLDLPSLPMREKMPIRQEKNTVPRT